MTQPRFSSKLKRSIQAIVSVLLDDDDEFIIEQENELFKKFLFDQNESNCAYTACLSHVVGIGNKPQRRKEVEHDDSFCDEEVPKLSLETFQSLFGVSRKIVQVLMEKLAIEHSNYPTKFRVPLQKRILMMLWILSNQESFRSVGERFGMMAPGNVHYVFYSMCDAICALTNYEISWPDRTKQHLLANQFLEKFHVENTFGVIGCIYIAIKCPDKNEQYYDHKGVPSICLQAVCDHKLCFLDICPGKPGSYSRAKVFLQSPLCSKLSSITADGLTITGNMEYPSSSELSTVNKSIRTPKSDSLNLISMAFAKLKNTFQRLKYIDMQRLESTVKLIQTACTLHNLVIAEDEEMNLEIPQLL